VPTQSESAPPAQATADPATMATAQSEVAARATAPSVGKAASASAVQTEVTGKAQSLEAAVLVNRYVDIYHYARLLVVSGKITQIVGVIAAAGWVVYGVYARAAIEGGSFECFMAFVAAFLVLLSLYIAGLIQCAFGQLAKAVVDSAVNTSPFLTNNERARVMGLWDNTRRASQ